MECHKLGPKAYRVTKKFELVTITSPLFDMDFLKVDYTRRRARRNWAWSSGGSVPTWT